MSESEDKKKEGQQTPPETRLYSTPGVDPNATVDSPSIPKVHLSDSYLDALSERFALIQELGRGGMGVVYKARDKVTDEIIALKVLRPEIAQDSSLIERFKSEVRLSKKITHKNVCRIFDLHLIGGTAAITMEFVEGRTLRSWLLENLSFSIRRGTQLAQQIISGLKEAHDQGVVHRDLKPENLMLTPEGNIKIMDFGIARSLEGSTTVTEGLTGTPAYMSPEQAEGKDIDHRTDIYALGLILYEMFTGQMAFTGDTPVAVAFKQVHETPTTPREVDPDVPPRIEKAILKCLEKKPKKRFQSVEELEAVLGQREELTPLPEAKPADTEPDLSKIQLPPHLTSWRPSDWYCLGGGVVGLLLCFLLAPLYHPFSMYRIEIDKDEARKVAQEAASTLGWEEQDYSGEVLEFVRIGQETNSLATSALHQKNTRDEKIAAETIQAMFGQDTSVLEKEPQILWWVDRNDVYTWGVRLNDFIYLVYGTTVQDGKVSYVFQRMRQSKPLPRISLPPHDAVRVRSFFAWLFPGLRHLRMEWLLSLTVLVLAYLFYARGLLRKKFYGSHLLLAAGFSSLMIAIQWDLLTSKEKNLKSILAAYELTVIHDIFVAVAAGVVLTVVFYVVMTTVRYYMVRTIPNHAGPLYELFRLPLSSKPGALSILRGAVLGAAFAGVFSGSSWVASYFVNVFPYAGSFFFMRWISHPLITGAEAAFAAFWIPWVVVAFPLALLHRVTKKQSVLLLASVLVWLALGMSLSGAVIGPLWATYASIIVQAVFFSWVFLRFDLLTTALAVLVAETLLFQYPVFLMFGGIQPVAYSMGMVACVVVILYALIVFFRPQLTEAKRRVATVFE